MTSQNAGIAAPPPAKPVPKWQRWLTIFVGIVVMITGAVRVANYFVTKDNLPACDSRRAKDTLSDAFKEKKLNPTSYSEIKTISSSNDLVECEATLPAGDQGTLDVQYKFVRSDAGQQIQYTIGAKPQ
ncbi:MAG TPA: hypothetical protein VH414_21705 [Lichenihabitans sp.]|jgi:hypothetical protein|nr:hypothetical protein [Lichenihabitans sp.]